MSLRFEDNSGRARCGCKGPGAEGWLRSQGYRVPAGANSAALDAEGVFVARLATAEFLVEAMEQDSAVATAARVRALRTQLSERAQPRDVYAVARQDRVMTISGVGLNALLRQTCSIDFAPIFESCDGADVSGEQPVLLTSMIGIGVVAWPQQLSAGPVVTLWYEPSYGHYFWNMLRKVAGSDR